MKKRVVLLICLFILVCIIAFLAYSNYTKEKITGKIVTGEATGGGLAVSISVIVGDPSITIISPENETYTTGENLQLNYYASNVHIIWYNLDKTVNTTITGNTTFNASEGAHTLYLYANNTNGNITSDSVTFNIDSSTFRVHYNNYKNQGSSMDFNSSSYEDLQDLEEIILEIPAHGKIEFNEAINMTEDSSYDNECDLDSYTNISSNYIEINSTALPNFNKSATLHLYNLTFSNPRILRDGSVCPNTICTEISYSTGILIFNVTHFTTYSSEETPSSPAQQPSGGGSSGAAIVSLTYLSISPESIKVKLSQGGKTIKNILLTNEKSGNLTVNIENPKLKDFIEISETNFTLNIGETKVIALDITVDENSIPNLYIGNLIINAQGTKKEVPIVIEVESKSSLFDVNLKIPEKYKYISQGEVVSAEISLYNLGGTGKVDVLVEYAILNKNGDEILREQETIAVETSISFVRSFKLPEDVGLGKYFLYVKTTYNGLVASASSQFSIRIIPPLTLLDLILYIIIGILIIVAFVIFFEIRKIKKHIKHHKIDEHALMQKGFIKSHKKSS